MDDLEEEEGWSYEQTGMERTDGRQGEMLR